MSKISVSPVFLKLGILSVLEVTSHHAALMAVNALVGSRLSYYLSMQAFYFPLHAVFDLKTRTSRL